MPAPPPALAARVESTVVLAQAEATTRPCGTTKTFFAGTAIADRDNWYGAHLSALGERIFCQKSEPGPAVYRLTWLPSFDHSIVVRIEQRAKGYRLEAKAESGAGGYEPGHLARDTVRSLSAAERDAFEHLLQESNFWHLPTVPPPNGRMGLDGAQWVLEGIADGRYHVVDRWSPEQDGPDTKYRQLAEWMLAESRLVPAKLVRDY